MNLAGKKLVLIGGAGLIGSHLADLLTKEDVREIVIYDNFVRGRVANLENALKDSRVKIFDIGGDIMHVDILGAALKGSDGAFHLAALWLLQCEEFPQSAFDVNVRGTFNVIEACARMGVKRLVYSSSASVYGDAIEEPMTEDHPYRNTTFYGATKIAGEHLLRAYHNRRGCALQYVGLRYMNVYGPRQDRKGAYTSVIMRMLDRLDAGEDLEVIGDGTQAYDFVHVADCARANVLGMQADVSDQFYNVGTGTKTSVLELAEKLMDARGIRRNIRFLRPERSFVRNRIGNTAKASKDLGFTARVDLDSGLRSTVEWCLSEKQLSLTVEKRAREGNE